MRALPLIAAATALSLSACSLLGDEPSPSPSVAATPAPPSEPTTLTALYGIDAAHELEVEPSDAEQLAVQLIIQECMTEAGWPYAIPAHLLGGDEPQDPDAQDAERRQSQGYGFVSNTLQMHGIAPDWGIEDPNYQYMESLPEAEAERFSAALWGGSGCFAAHVDNSDPFDGFVEAAYSLLSPREIENEQANPYYVWNYYYGSGAAEGFTSFDPRQDAANVAFRECAADAGYPDHLNPGRMQQALGKEIEVAVAELVDGVDATEEADLPPTVLAEVEALRNQEVDMATATASCEQAWLDVYAVLSAEWQAAYAADNWGSIWPQLNVLRQRDDAPAEWAAQWDDYPPDADESP